MSFSFYHQLNAMDCGTTALRMIAKHYGRHYNANTLRQKAGISKAGVSLLGISETVEKIGFRTRGVKLTLLMNNYQKQHFHVFCIGIKIILWFFSPSHTREVDRCGLK